MGEADRIQTYIIGGVDYYNARLSSFEVVLARAMTYGMPLSATTSFLVYEFGLGRIIFTAIVG